MLEKLTLRIRRLNPFIIGILTLLALIGTVMLYSAAEGSFSPWAGKHLLRFCFGLGVMIAVSLVDIRTWSSLAYPLYGLALLSLIAVDIMGFVGMGAQRWLDLYVFNLQPSELMKLSLILALARYLHSRSQEEIFHLRYLLIPGFMIILPAILVMQQPDLGTAIVLILCGGSIFFIAGVKWWKFAAILAGLSISTPILWTHLKDYQKNRILTFLNPDTNPLHSGYHVIQSKIALGSGGFWGKGFLQGTQSHLNFLPAKQTDFIFTMLCEEFGFIGGLFVVLLYSLLIFYGFSVALRSHHAFGRYLAIGIASMLFWYVFINIAMVAGLIPVVGVPLPLLSYGGTALMTLMTGMGLLASIVNHHDVRIGR